MIIRRHGVRVSRATNAPTDGVAMTVPWVRPKGAASLMPLSRRDAGTDDPPIYARVCGWLGPADGALARAGIDRDEVFVFPAETPKSGT